MKINRIKQKSKHTNASSVRKKKKKKSKSVRAEGINGGRIIRERNERKQTAREIQ